MTDATDSGLHFKPLPKVGQEMGRFLIEREMPRGGQARVYRAWQTDLNRPIALKLLPSSFATNDEAHARFRREIDNVARLNHPNIVRVFEAGEIEGHSFFTMEFLEGRDAEDLIKKSPLSPDDAAGIIEAVARAVGEAHRNAIVHRDIKPGNIILRADDTPVLTDFGLAQDLGHSEQLTQTGVSMGTPAYMSPEQARGERDRVGVKSDIYSLGATLFTLLTGKRPVTGESAYELMVKVAELEAPRWGRNALEDVPPDLRAIVEMAMQNDPAKRYRSADDFADDLERYLHGEWVVARSRSKIAKLWIRSRRYLAVASVAGVALLVATALVVNSLTPGSGANDTPPWRDVKEIGIADEPNADIESLFDKDGSWTRHNATAKRGEGRALILERVSDGPIEISPRESVCWGDFSVNLEFEVEDVSESIAFNVGSPIEGEPAYSFVAGAGASDRFELQRLGVAVASGYRANRTNVIQNGQRYALSIERTGERLSFELREVANDVAVAAITYADDYPALLGDRRRFGILAHVDQLTLQPIAVTHSEGSLNAEQLLFQVGQYTEAELRLSVRLEDTLSRNASLEERERRAQDRYLQARCLTQLKRYPEARASLSRTKVLTSDNALRMRAFLLSSRLEALEGRDREALAHLFVASQQLPSGVGAATQTWHAAMTQAQTLDDTTRANLYYEFVAKNAVGNALLVMDALSSQATIALNSDEPDHTTALQLLRRASNPAYSRFGHSFVSVLNQRFDLRWPEIATERDALDESQSAFDEITTCATLAYRSSDEWGVADDSLVTMLARASWAQRLSADQQVSVDDARRWLQVARNNASDDLTKHYVDALLLLMAEERPASGVTIEQRVALWNEFAAELPDDNADYDALLEICEFFVASENPNLPDDRKRRETLLLRRLARSLPTAPAWFTAGADSEAFGLYLIGLYRLSVDRPSATAAFDAASARKSTGVLRLLRGRVTDWMPN